MVVDCIRSSLVSISEKGLFIAIDGIHGCGKTTVVKHLARRLTEAGYSVIATREIGGSPFRDEIRELTDRLDDEDAEAVLLLVLAARAEHVRQLIRPSLAQNKVVITDRFTPSTYVYQYHCVDQLSQEEVDTVKRLNDFATGGLSPSLTIILDVPVEVALNRKNNAQSLGKWERKPSKYHQKAREGYLYFAHLKEWAIVDADQPLETVLGEVEQLVAPLLLSSDKM